jgi:hypothetical protein
LQTDVEAPSINIQAPEKHQAPTFKSSPTAFFGGLEFGISLELGAWMLEL